MEQGAGEDPMHLYQVFQNSFNKITTTTTTKPASTPAMYGDWGTDPQYLQQHQEPYGAMGTYDQSGYYMSPDPNTGYYPQQPYGMVQSPVEDSTSPLWSPPCTPVSSGPPSSLPHPPTSSCPPFYDRVKPDPDSLTGLDDALNILKSHAVGDPDTGRGQTSLTAGYPSHPPPPLLPPNYRKGDDLPSSPYGPPSSPLPTVSSSSSRGGKRKKNPTGSSEEDNLEPEVKFVKEKERRYSNNARERMRIRDINDALNELGRVCMMLKPNKGDKPQTKLWIHYMAVDVINNLEHQVRDRNLNPSAVCVNRPPNT